MIHVDGNLKIDTYNDNTGSLITVSPQGTVVEQNENNIYASSTETKSRCSSINSRIRFAGKRGMKINLFRVIIALHECGLFSDENGLRPTQEEVFSSFGELLCENFSDFQKNLSAAKNVNNDSHAPFEIFQELAGAYEKYMNK